ncbi:MAG TPA: 4a-hydroxytetrahydrobiopterin dehydratase [Porticoccaceae bacterium]|nr:4a-hydroxytetrahydrobiopterin dehydratase [Porticoccaceae bacterium]HCO60484.1 4a-hydroxytetrahydrobiopterin dehydratase [Porticoccaceae bacterium]
MNSKHSIPTLDLADKQLAALSSAPLNKGEQTERLRSLPDWQINKLENAYHLRCDFSFQRYADALGFTANIGELAEACGHYPTIITAYLRVTVIWQAVDNSNLSEREFALAAHTTELAQRR